MTQPVASNPSPWLLLARILRPQGRKGEVLADLYTDFPDRFSDAPRVFLAPSGFSGPPGQASPRVVAGFFLPMGRNAGRIVLHFEGVTSIEAAESLSGLEVLVPHEERLTPEEDETYISDLIGCTVLNAATPIGTVDDVQFPTTPDGQRRLEDAAPLLVVLSPAGDEILIPFVKQFLVSLDPQSHRILMNLPDGLIEVNTPNREP